MQNGGWKITKGSGIKMEIYELEKIMKEKGLVIRAIPEKIRCVYDASNLDKHPNGIIEYIPQFKREMCVVWQIPKHAGQFMIESINHEFATVEFKNKKYFNSIADAINYIYGGNYEKTCINSNH